MSRVRSRRERFGLKRPDDRRTAAERGYGGRWARVSKRWRESNPNCALCWEREGIVTPVDLVDHIEAVSGPADPRFFDETNFQSLCRRCHAIKTHGETL